MEGSDEGANNESVLLIASTSAPFDRDDVPVARAEALESRVEVVPLVCGVVGKWVVSGFQPGPETARPKEGLNEEVAVEQRSVVPGNHEPFRLLTRFRLGELLVGFMKAFFSDDLHDEEKSKQERCENPEK